ncbi:phosphatidylglycerophosphatase [Pasteurellaceae bacterium Pebbles2]|nr:phosphatidylglycerophosphatase [Pasteurellaceae bacterium Pebbles2]
MTTSQNPLKQLRFSNPIHLLAVGFGSGLIHPAPGTWGSLAGLAIGTILWQWLPWKIFIFFTALCFILGCYFCGKTAKDMGVHDHGSIVWDEFVGIWLVMLVMPEMSLAWCAAVFVLFRLFDILKPYPIKIFDEKLESGFGIMIDDVLAAVYAILVIKLYLIFS